MGRADYIICDRCDGKAFYDGNEGARDYMPEDYIVYCEPCARAVKAERAALLAAAEGALAVLDALSVDRPERGALRAAIAQAKGEA